MRGLELFFNALVRRGFCLLLGAVLLLFFAHPLAVLALKGFGIARNAFDPTAAIVIKSLASPETWRAFGNSLRNAMGVTFLTMLVSGALAWLVVKTDLPGKKLVAGLSLGTFVIPPYILGLSWLQLFGKNGYLHRFLHTTLGWERYTFHYYSVDAVTIVMSLHLYPLVFLVLRNALENQDRALDQAALVSGATPLQTTLTVTLPLAVPSLLAVGLLVFSRALANFDIPALLALPVRKEFLTTRIYTALNNLDLGTASVLSLFLVLFSGALFSGTLLFQRNTNRFSTEGTGTKSKAAEFPLGRLKWVAAGAVFLFQFPTTILPLGAILISSFLKRWGLPLRGEYLTFNNYIQLLFRNDQAAAAFRNSFLYGAAGIGFAVVLVCAIVFITYRSDRRITGILEAFASWPIAAPNIVLAVAAILAWNGPPLALYGTPWVIIVTYMTLFTPIILKNISGLVRGQDRRQIQAARVAGASPARAFFDILLPSFTPGLKAGGLICFLIALRDIPIALLLYSSGQETLGVLLFGMQSQAYGLEMTSALAVVMLLLLLAGDFFVKTIKNGIRNVALVD